MMNSKIAQQALPKAKSYELRDAKLNGLLLRVHHFASRLAMGAVDLNTIRELLGHSDYGMTLRYAHLAPEHRREAVEVLDKPRPHIKIVATK